jgi:hypothetical protein
VLGSDKVLEPMRNESGFRYAVETQTC